MLATDGAPGMVAAARRKVEAAGLRDLVEVRQLAFDELPRLGGQGPAPLAGGPPFDGAFSSFGGFNCIADPRGPARDLATLLRPGARVLLCVMGPLVPWEWGWFLLRGQPGKALRRLRPGGAAWRGMVIRYPSIGAMRVPGAAHRRDRRLAAPYLCRALGRAAPAPARPARPLGAPLGDPAAPPLARRPLSSRARAPVSAAADWPLACPACRLDLGPLSAYRGRGEVRCPGCGLVAPCVEGIWRFLPPAAAARFAPFLADYTRIRHAEQRGSDDPAYYLGLPNCPPDHPIAAQWALRRRTFATFTRRVLPRLGSGLRVVDLGAGVGWLTHRLALLGHHPMAVDLTTDDRDGLGAGRHYRPATSNECRDRRQTAAAPIVASRGTPCWSEPRPWPRVQADFDRLPLASEAADLVIFNASLHYSTDYEVTLAEALRVLVPGGTLAVLESPIYSQSGSGRRMVEERRADFARRYGTSSEALPSRDYLTWEGIEDLGSRLGIRFQAVTPWYGWRWALRPWSARLRRRREPSRFAILLAKKS